MLRTAVFLFAIAGVVSGQTTSVTQCTDSPGEMPINLYVEGCLEPPCQLPQLQDAVMHAVFRVPRLVTSMTTRAVAFLNIGVTTLRIPYPLGPDAVTCNFLTNTYCPLVPGEIVQYRFAMFIQAAFQAGTVAGLELVVVDQDNLPLFCFRTTISILPPVSARITADDKDEKDPKNVLLN